MAREGQIALFSFPQTDQQEGKLRPALVVRQLPGRYNDWLICMISSQAHRISAPTTDELISESDADYKSSGLKRASVIRATRLAVVQEDILAGAIGEIGKGRLTRIRDNLAKWISGRQPTGAANSGSAPAPPE